MIAIGLLFVRMLCDYFKSRLYQQPQGACSIMRDERRRSERSDLHKKPAPRPGRATALKLATRPALMGSLPDSNTIGIVAVADLAACAAGGLNAAITAT